MGMDRLGDSVSGLGRINDFFNLINVRFRDDELVFVVFRWDVFFFLVDKLLEFVCFLRNFFLFFL